MAQTDPSRDAPKAAAGYLRRSTDRQEQSLGDQREAIESYAQREGFKVFEWYVDDAISGTTTEARKAFQALIEASQKPACPFAYVLVYDVKRFGRVDTDEAGYYRHLLRRAGIEVIYTSEGFNGGDSDDLIRSVKQWQARAESKDLSKVTIRGQVSVVDKGYWSGGVPPYGYDFLYEDPEGKPIRRIRYTIEGCKEEYDPAGHLVRIHPRGTRLARPKTDHPRLVLSDPNRVALVERIFRMYVEEELGYRTIAEKLNDEGIASPRDGHWTSSTDAAWSHGTIRTLLLNGTYTGDTYWNRRSYSKFYRISGRRALERPRQRSGKPDWNPQQDWLIVKDTHPGIISRQTYQQVIRRQRAPRRRGQSSAYRRGTPTESPYLLSGLLRCVCGHAFIGTTTTKHKRTKAGRPVKTAYYLCGGHLQKGSPKCIGLRIPLIDMESLIWRLVELRLKDLCAGGEALLSRAMGGDEAGVDAGRKNITRDLRARIEGINRQSSTLLDQMTGDAAPRKREKHEELGGQRQALEEELFELEAAAPAQGADLTHVAAVFQIYRARLRSVRSGADNQRKKNFLQGLIHSIVIDPRQGRAAIAWLHRPKPAGD